METSINVKVIFTSPLRNVNESITNTFKVLKVLVIAVNDFNAKKDCQVCIVGYLAIQNATDIYIHSLCNYTVLFCCIHVTAFHQF